jgi:ankyrin repeat protein
MPIDPLHVSVRLNHVEIVNLLLLDKRVDANSLDENGYTPFYHAIMLGSDNMVTRLLQQPSLRPNFRTTGGRHPLQLSTSL